MKNIRLVSIKFHKFRLLKLSSIQTIIINFKERFHWFVGSNGSGKSSIVGESTPHAADTSLYFEGGYRQAIWTVDDKEYELTSSIGAKKHTHSFCLVLPDGTREEMNHGHTVTVYKSLVDSIFGISKESHDIAIGRLNLTEMRPGERKALFTSLSANDYTYALGYYKRLFTLYRDTQGSLRTDQGRLVELKAGVVNGDEEKTCVEEIRKLKVQVEALMDVRPNVSEPRHEVERKIDNIRKDIQKLYTGFMDYSKKNKGLFPLESEDFLRNKVSMLEASYQVNENFIDTSYRAFNEATKILESMTKNSSDSVKGLETQLEQLNEKFLGYEYAYLSSATNVQEALVCIKDAQASFHPVRDSIFAMDPEDAQNGTALQSAVSRLSDERFHLSKTVENLAREVDEINKHEHDPGVECPKCSFKFNPLFSKQKVLNLSGDLERSKKELENVNVALSNTQTSLTRVQSFNRGQDVWHAYIRKYPSLNDLWSFVMNEKLHFLDPFSIEQHFSFFFTELQKKVDQEITQRAIEDVRKKLEWNKHVDIERLARTEEDVREMQVVLTNAYEKRSVDLEELRHYKGKAILSQRFRETGDKANALKATLEELISKDYDHMERSALSDFIRNLDVEISFREQKLRQLTTKNAEMIRLETLIAGSEKKIKALKDAMTVLSPSEGLIARGLTGFINHFTSLMNTVIARIATRKMEIPLLKTTNDEFELDFSIPIEVTTEDGSLLVPPDIGLCSLGQKEIINLAFRILYLKFKGLDGGILPLDEFGSNLDHVHKQKAFEAIRQLLSISNFSQVFMVSHITSTYGLMDGAGITVLCPANVVIPDGVAYNGTTEIVPY